MQGEQGSSHDERLAELVEEFARAQREGESPDVEGYARRHPDLAEDIRRIFPALGLLGAAALKQAGPAPATRADLDELGDSVLLRLEQQGATLGNLSPPGPASADDEQEPTSGRPDGRGKYRALVEIAHGGVGRVLRGRDVDLGRDVALKVLRERFVGDPDMLRRFVEEAQIAGQLQHPGIVPVYELGLQDGRPFFAMKLVDGETLEELLARRAHPSEEQQRFLRILEQVSQAVAYAHSRGVLHRDLKPHNVMVGAFGEIQVVDWGMAKILWQQAGDGRAPAPEPADDGIAPVESLRSGDSELASITGTVLGTPAYMPPEQATGDVEHLDRRSDVFALGAILCQVLTGAPPYPGPKEEALAAARGARLDDALRRLAQHVTEPDLAALARDCLCPDPAGRPRDALEVAQRLGRFLTGVEQRVVEAHVSERAAHRTKRLALGTVAVVAVALLVSLFSWKSADRARTAAETSLSNFNALHLVQRLEDVEASLADLYPAARTDPGALEDWLRGTWGLLEPTLAGLETSLDRLEAGTRSGADEFLLQTLREVHTRFVDFGVGPRSVVASIREDVGWSAVVKQRTVGDHADEWRAAVEAIAASPAYGGLELAPQVGLIPLGFDPRSGLHEFYHLRSATPGTPLPSRDPGSGRFTITEDTGMVFVLLPGGKTTVGAQNEDPDEDYYDPQARAPDRDLHSVVLDPFLLSKYELTQGQWLRLSLLESSNEYSAGEPLDPEWKSAPITLAHPKDRESHDAWHLLARHDLDFPREEQWEYACRAGTTTPWYTGADPASLVGHANLADPTAGKKVADWGRDGLEVEDGHVVHAPVGSFEPNPLGLHDMHGNVKEVCWSWAKDGRPKVWRGGSFETPPERARSAWRRFMAPDHARGLRLARPIQPRLFEEARWPPTLEVREPTSVLCADLDGDGDVDLFSGGSVGLPDGPGGRPRTWLHLNDGSGGLRDVSETHLPMVFTESHVMQAEACDVDGDGDLDLVWVCNAKQNRLYLNEGEARFVDATATHLPAVADSSAGMAMGDLDGDGSPDLLVANHGGDTGERNRMYLNDGTGHFQETTSSHLPPAPEGREEDSTFDLALGDVDGDGDLDLVCANRHYGYQNRLYRNDGSGHFTDVTEACMPGIHLDRQGTGDMTESVALGDVDGDGDLDLVCANGWGIHWQRNRLYLNDGTGSFVDRSDTHLPEDHTTTMRMRLGDLDGDGDLDLVGTTRREWRTILLLNDGTGRFREASATHVRTSPWVNEFGYQECEFGLADLDGDGDLDLVGGGGRARIYRNLSNLGAEQR